MRTVGHAMGIADTGHVYAHELQLGAHVCAGELRGEITADGVGTRVLALDTMVINTIALMILYGLSLGTEIFFEAAMIIAMLGFVSTVAYARFMLRGNIIE